MKYKEVVLVGEKVILNKLNKADASALARLANNLNIWNNVRDYFPYPYTEADALSFLTNVQSDNCQCQFAIRFNNEFCGIIGAEPQKDVYRLSAEMGYWIGEEYWNKGIVSDAIKLITKYTFEELGIIRIFSSVFEFNHASKRVLEKNNFVLEAIKKKAVIKNKIVMDEYSFVLMR